MSPALVVVIYANPDAYPPTVNAVRILSAHFRVTVISASHCEAARSWPPSVRIERVVRIGSDATRTEKVGRFLRFAAAIRRAVAEERPGVVLVYDAHALVATTLAQVRAPIVFHRHEIEDATDLRSLGGWALFAARSLSKRAKLVVFPDRGRAEVFRRAVPEVVPVIVPNYPLRADSPAVDLDAIVGARFDRRELFYRGAMGPSNGVREAVLALAESARASRFTLCGHQDPSFRATLDEVIRSSKLEDRVTIAGFLPWEELNRVTASASVGVMLYQSAQAGLNFSVTATNKLYEYAAAGLPAVAPDRPEYRELLGAEPWIELVDERDPRSIARGIDRILDDPARYAARCRAARRAFEERFNYEMAFAEVLAKILELAATAPRS